MELLRILLMSLCIFAYAAANSSESAKLVNNSKPNRSYLHAIYEDLLEQQWQPQEQRCLRQLLTVITNVQNSTLWATWIWDAMQFPLGQLYGSRNHLGNFDQCVNFPWKDHPEFRTQYCLADIKLSELDPNETKIDLFGTTNNYIRYKTKHGLRFNTMLWGVCAPAGCGAESLAKFAGAMFRSTHLGQMELDTDVTVNPAYCQLSGEIEESTFNEYIFKSVLFFVVLTVLCTCYVNVKGTETESSVLNIAKAFHLGTNARQVITADDHPIKCLVGLRMVLTFMVLLGHQWFMKNVYGVINAGEVDKILNNPIKSMRFNAELIVDAFFMISGLLLTMSLLGRNGKNINIFTTIAKRYIRLIIPVLPMLLLMPIFYSSGGAGPLVKMYDTQEIELCKKNWWTVILMIGNYKDITNMCCPATWSMACDFHLHVIGVVLYWVYLKNRRVSIMAYIILATSSFIAPVVYGYLHNKPAVFQFDFHSSDNYRKFPIGDPAYVHTHLRASPFFVGIAIGYFMAKFHPDKHRNILSKKLSTLLFLVLLSIFLFINYLPAIYCEAKYGPLEGALVSVLRRNSFAAIIIFCVIISEYGSIPYISSILSWSGMVPFGKLSYGVYLINLLILTRSFSRTRVPLHSDALGDVNNTFSLLVAASAMGLFLWLFWEAPMMNLLDMLFKRFGSKRRVRQEHKNHTYEILLYQNGTGVNGKLDKKLN